MSGDTLLTLYGTIPPLSEVLFWRHIFNLRFIPFSMCFYFLDWPRRSAALPFLFVFYFLNYQLSYL